MSTDTNMKFRSDGVFENDTLSSPALIQLQIYDVDDDDTSLEYTDTSTTTWSLVDKIELKVPGNTGEPTLRFLWRDPNDPEVITASDTPSPSSSQGNGYTDYTLPVPAQLHATFQYDFAGGLPGFRLNVKVTRKS